MLLPSNITVFAYDFSGSGLSEGEYVSLGYYEKEDLKSVVEYLRLEGKTSKIGLWGRSMGAHTWSAGLVPSFQLLCSYRCNLRSWF